MHPRTTTLSARGSKKAPNLVSLLVALASTPSKASLMPKTNPKINAVQDAPFWSSAERITMNRIGEISIRVIVIKFAGVKLCIQISFGELQNSSNYLRLNCEHIGSYGFYDFYISKLSYRKVT